MSASLDNELTALLSESEERHMCLAPPNRRLHDALRRRIWPISCQPVVVNPYPGIFARQAYWDALNPLERTLHEVRALTFLHPTWVFSDVTAAAVRGWNVSYALLEELHLCAPYHLRAAAAINHVSPHCSPDHVDGIPVTPVEQTLFDCLRKRDIRLSLPIADSALRQMGLTAPDAVELLKAYGPLRRRQHLKRATRVLALADPRSESGGESIARATMLALGFQAPELQIVYPDPIEPQRHMRADFSWKLPDGATVLGELDGKQKYVDPEMTHGESVVNALTRERIRESRLSITGARIMRFSFNDVLDECYFAHLLTSYGIPRNNTLPAEVMGHELTRIRAVGTYDELTPLECYPEL